MDLRNTPEDQSQRMLNALEPGTMMPIHRHLASSETVALLRGKIRWYFYDDNGKLDEEVILDANGDIRCINVEKGRWHSLECSYYVEHLSLMMDLRIIFTTIKNVLQRKDIEVVPNLMDFDEYRRQQQAGRVFLKVEDAIIND